MNLVSPYDKFADTTAPAADTASGGEVHATNLGGSRPCGAVQLGKDMCHESRCTWPNNARAHLTASLAAHEGPSISQSAPAHVGAMLCRTLPCWFGLLLAESA